MRTPLTLALVTSLQLLALVGFQLVALAALGVGAQSDSFVAAQAVPAVLTAILATALQSVWQPRLAVAGKALGAWREQHRCAHAQGLLTVGAACIVSGASAPAWVPALYAGLDQDTRQMVLWMTPPLLLACVFNSASAVLTTAQRGRDRLVSAELIALAGSVLALIVAWPAIRAGGVMAAAYVAMGRAVLVWALLLLLVGGSRPNWPGGWNDHDSWRQLRPLIFGSGIYKASPLVDRFWSAMGAAGSVTLFSLAQTGMSALASVFERSLCMPVASRIARCVAEGDARAAQRLYRRSAASVAVWSVVVGLLLLLSKSWWAGSLGGLLNISPDQVRTLWLLCSLLLGYLFVAAAGTAVVSVFYAMGDTRTPTAIGLAGFLVGVALKSAGFLWAGIEGLALATSVYHLLNLVALGVAVEWRIRQTLAPGGPA